MKSKTLKIITALFILTTVVAPLSALAQTPPAFTSPTIDAGNPGAIGSTNQGSGLMESNAGSGLSATGIQTPNSPTTQTTPTAFTTTGNEFNVGSGGLTGNTSSGASASAAQPNTSSGASASAAQPNTGTGSSFSWSNLLAAIDPVTWVPKALDALMELVVLPVAGAVLAVAGLLFDKSVLYSLNIYNLISGATGAGGAIVLGWTVIRDIFNMMFIFSIIWISIETMLDLGKWHGKQVLTKVIIAAILINFSFFITEVIIDAGNIFATWFYNGIQTAISTTGTTSVTSGVSSIAGALAASLGLFGIYGNGVSGAGGASVLGSIVSGGLNASVNQLLGSFIRLGVVAFATYIFAYVAVLFFARTISLMFSLVLSPVGFAGSVLPQTQEYSKKWWDELLKDVLLAPVFLLFLYVIIDFTTTPLFKGLNFSTNTTGAFDITPYFKYFLLAGMLLYALKAAKKFSGALGEQVSGIAKQLGGLASGAITGVATGGMGLALRGTVGRAASKLGENETLKDFAAKSRIADFGLKRVQGVAGASFDVRNTKLAAGIASTGIDLGKGGGQGGYQGMLDRQVKTRTERAESLGYDKEKAAVAEAKLAREQARLRRAENTKRSLTSAGAAPAAIAAAQAQIDTYENNIRARRTDVTNVKTARLDAMATRLNKPSYDTVWTKVARKDKVGAARIENTKLKKDLERMDGDLKETNSDIKDLEKRQKASSAANPFTPAEQTELNRLYSKRSGQENRKRSVQGKINSNDLVS